MNTEVNFVNEIKNGLIKLMPRKKWTEVRNFTSFRKCINKYTFFFFYCYFFLLFLLLFEDNLLRKIRGPWHIGLTFYLFILFFTWILFILNICFKHHMTSFFGEQKILITWSDVSSLICYGLGMGWRKKSLKGSVAYGVWF